MTDKRGLKLTVKFEKCSRSSDQEGNYAMIKVKVVVDRADGVASKAQLLKKGVGAIWNYHWIEETFSTKAEAEQWAAVCVEKITREYQVQKARVDSLEIPEDYEVFA